MNGKQFWPTRIAHAVGESLDPGTFEVARALVEAGAPPDRVPGSDHSRLWHAAFTHNADAVDFLLSLGLRPMADSSNGRTPLHAVAWQGEHRSARMKAACERIIRTLVGAGNPIDARDGHGRTPLDEAYDGDWRNDTAIRVLLELEAGPARRRAEPGGDEEPEELPNA